MPRAPAGPCTFPGCPRRAVPPGSRCASHRRGPEGHPFTKFYRSKAWRDRSTRYRREHPICEWPGCGRPSAETDHILSLTDGGEPLADENLQALCHRHHDEKTWADRKRRVAG